MLRLNWTSHTSQIHWTALFLFSSIPLTEAHVRYRSGLKSCMIWSADLQQCTISSCSHNLYDIHLGATNATILSIRGVTIPIYLVSSTTDSNRRHVVLFKPVTILTSDPKSEFLCQLSLYCAEPTDPLKHLVHLGYLPRPRHHVSPLCSQPNCSHRVPKAEATLSAC